MALSLAVSYFHRQCMYGHHNWEEANLRQCDDLIRSLITRDWAAAYFERRGVDQRTWPLVSPLAPTGAVTSLPPEQWSRSATRRGWTADQLLLLLLRMRMARSGIRWRCRWCQCWHRGCRVSLAIGRYAMIEPGITTAAAETSVAQYQNRWKKDR